MPETMNLPFFYKMGARGADRGQFLCSFHFSVSVRAIGIWHPFLRERERDEVRKWIEENVRAENRRRQNLSFFSAVAAKLVVTTLPLVTLPAKQKERLLLLPLSLSSFLPSFLRPSPNPISNFGFSSKFFRARNQSTD